MQITFTLPEWAEDRHLYLMAGIEMVAYKLYGEDKVYTKKNRCSACGECCLKIQSGTLLRAKEDGSCSFLSDYMECLLGIFRPVGCSVSMHRVGDTPNCTVEYR